MGARILALLHHCDGDVAELRFQLGRGLQELGEPDRAGEARRTAADEEDADIDALIGRGLRGDDELG